MNKKHILSIGFGVMLLVSVSVSGIGDHVPNEDTYINPAEEGQNGIKILCLGNSITEGNYGWDPRELNVRNAYRSHLYWMLRYGYTTWYTTDFHPGPLPNVQFVGNEFNGSAITNTYVDPSHPAYEQPFDIDHEGWSGGFVSHLVDSIDGWLERLEEKNEIPDVILLHIGTNDVCVKYGYLGFPTKELAELLEKIKNNKLCANTVTLVARMIYMDPHNVLKGWKAERGNVQVEKYHSFITTLLETDKYGFKNCKTRRYKAPRFVAVDMPFLGHEKYQDFQHPNHTFEPIENNGYLSIAEYWFEGLFTKYVIVDFINNDPAITCRLRPKIFPGSGGRFRLPYRCCNKWIHYFEDQEGLIWYPGDLVSLEQRDEGTFAVHYWQCNKTRKKNRK